MADDLIDIVYHDWGDAPCGKLAYESIGKPLGAVAPGAYVFDGHRTLDGSTPAHLDPLICAGCGQDTGVKFAPPSPVGRTI